MVADQTCLHIINVRTHIHLQVSFPAGFLNIDASISTRY